MKTLNFMNVTDLYF